MPRRAQPPDSIANTRRKNNTKKEKKEKRKKLLEHVIIHGIDPEVVNIIKGSSSSVFDRLQPVAQEVPARIVIEVAPPSEASTSSSVEQPATSGTVQHRQVIELNPSSSDDVTPSLEGQQQLATTVSVFQRLGSAPLHHQLEEAAAAEELQEDVLSVTYEGPEPEQDEEPPAPLRSVVTVPPTSTVRREKDRHPSYIRNPYIRS